MGLKYKGKTTCTYRCSSYRAFCCKASVKINSHGVTLSSGDAHTVNCHHKQCIPVPEERQHELASVGGDYSHEMEDFVKDLSLSDSSLTAGRIWKDTVSHFRSIAGASFIGLTKS